MLLEAAAIFLGPIVLGLLIGALLRQLLGGRISGSFAVISVLLLPTVMVAALTIRFPLVGLWDGMTEGFLFAAGILCALHRWYADWRNGLLTAGSVALSMVLLEVFARLCLGTPPAYPVGDEPYLLLATLLRTTPPDAAMFHSGAVPYFLEQNTMRADRDGHSLADRPPSAMVTKEIVCSIAYGPAYSSIIDVSRERAVVFPDHLTTHPNIVRRVLHIGDSMVFGANVHREHTFAADLEELEPGVQHIDGGISGTAPDDYLIMLRSWIAREPVDLAVMYLFAGNDLIGLDAPHPCSNSESLLTYEDGHARLRFPAAPHSDHGIGLRWLMINSPLPYLSRVMITEHSSAAAFLGSALESWSSRAAANSLDVQFQHLESILRSAHDELHQRHIPLVVVVLPAAGEIAVPNGSSAVLSSWARTAVPQLGIPELDATDLIRDALSRGEHPIQPDHVHFTEEGHWLMARWLHQRLPHSNQ